MKDFLKALKYVRDTNSWVFIMGNGGSASTANHFANDLLKMCKIKAISLCSNEAVVMAFGNDDGYENIFVNQLKILLTEDDLVITISTSGKSKNVLKAIEYAKLEGVDVLEFPRYKCHITVAEDRHLAFAHKIAKKLCQA